MRRFVVINVVGLIAAAVVSTSLARAEEVTPTPEPQLLAQVRPPGSTPPNPGTTPSAPQAPLGEKAGSKAQPKPQTVSPTAPTAGTMTLEPGKYGPKQKQQNVVPTSTELHQLEGEITKAHQGISPLHAYFEFLWDMEQWSNGCIKANYTVQDQQAAGCQGSDTLDQCKSKLYNWCMHVKHAAEEKNFMAVSQTVLAAAEQLAAAAKQYAIKVKLAMDAYAP